MDDTKLIASEEISLETVTWSVNHFVQYTLPMLNRKAEGKNLFIGAENLQEKHTRRLRVLQSLTANRFSIQALLGSQLMIEKVPLITMEECEAIASMIVEESINTYLTQNPMRVSALQEEAKSALDRNLQEILQNLTDTNTEMATEMLKIKVSGLVTSLAEKLFNYLTS